MSLRSFIAVALAACLLFGGISLVTGSTAYAAGVVWYVKEDGGSLMSVSGQSWDQAFNLLQTALDAAGPGDQIWIAAGTYYPTRGINEKYEDQNVDPRTRAFKLKNDVAIYGGFAGHETRLSQRDWRANATVLSGKIGSRADGGDSVYHVIYNENVSTSAILDGVTITGGNANTPKGYTAHGGGIINVSSSPILRNITVTGNHATFGGGMANIDRAHPTVTHAFFTANTATDGGAFYNIGGNMWLESSLLSGNRAGKGGAVYNTLSSDVTLINVTVAGNYSGGIRIGDVKTGAIHNESGRLIIENSVVWGNTHTVFHGEGMPIVRDSIIQNADMFSYIREWGDGILDVNPQFVSAVGADSTPSTGGDYRLKPTSPAIDAGREDTINVYVQTDLDGNERIVNGRIDLGAYESRTGAIGTIAAVPALPDVTVPMGTAAANVPLPAQATVVLADGKTMELPVMWERTGTPAYKADTAGTYHFTGTVQLPGPQVTNPEQHQATVNVVVAPGAVPNFTDIATHWAKSDIERMAVLGIIKGYPGGTFQPERQVTRAEYIAMVRRIAAADVTGAGTRFGDVPASHWALDDVTALEAKGWLIPAEYNLSLQPNGTIPRQEMARLVARAAGLTTRQVTKTDFADDAIIPAAFKGFVEVMVSEQLLRGYPDGTFGPGQGLTRAEAATMLTRLLNRGGQ